MTLRVGSEHVKKHLPVAILISLFTLSIICVISWTVFIDWFLSSIWAVFFCFFVCLVHFDWMPDIVSFTLLGAGFFFLFFFFFFKFYVWTQLIYSGTVWSFQGLLLRVLTWYQKLPKYFGLGLIVLFPVVLSFWVLYLTSYSSKDFFTWLWECGLFITPCEL